MYPLDVPAASPSGGPNSTAYQYGVDANFKRSRTSYAPAKNAGLAAKSRRKALRRGV